MTNLEGNATGGCVYPASEMCIRRMPTAQTTENPLPSDLSTKPLCLLFLQVKTGNKLASGRLNLTLLMHI